MPQKITLDVSDLALPTDEEIKVDGFAMNGCQYFSGKYLKENIPEWATAQKYELEDDKFYEVV